MRGAIVVSLVAACAVGVLAQNPPTAVSQRPPLRGGAIPDLEIVGRFDADGNGRLSAAERAHARAYLAEHPELRQAGARRGIVAVTGTAGPRVALADVTPVPVGVPLYDPDTVRTLFLQFEGDGWEQELEAFHRTDVEVPAALTVDGKVYRDVGVHFRGNNSFSMVPAGLKRPLTLTVDFVHEDQRLLGYRGLHLLNANQDPTMLRSVLYLEVSRQYIPAPKANFVRVVINGESWGLYVNQQPFDKDFLRDAFKTTDGVRLKSPNNSSGGGFSYLGDDLSAYRRWYEPKGKEDPAAWAALMELCRRIAQSPPEQLVRAVEPLLDLDGAMRFLALDAALINNDGYWNDGSDFNIYRDVAGRFHLVPHDVNEGFRGVGGARGGAGGAQLDPFVSVGDANKALLNKLLAVPALRAKYLAYMRDIGSTWLDWTRLGPMVERYRTLIRTEVERDTRKLFLLPEFTTGVYGPGDGTAADSRTLKGFADQRRTFLLNHPDVQAARVR